MKAIIQRVSHASCKAQGEFTGQIKDGFMVLLGVGKDDTDEQAKLLASKTANLRIFCDENDKMNLSLLDIQGEALVISNFTLCADTKKGNRYATNQGGVIKAPNTVKDSPKSTTVKGNDLRNGKKSK